MRVERVAADLQARRAREASVEEVAREVGAETEDVLEAMEASSAYRAISLQTPRASSDGDPGATLGDAIGRTEEGFDRAEQRAVLSGHDRADP